MIGPAVRPRVRRERLSGPRHHMKGIDFSSFAGLLLADGRPFQFKGITWPGAETEHGLVLGWRSRSLNSSLTL